MSKRCWEFSVQVELDEKTGRAELFCPRRTRWPRESVPCEKDENMKRLDYDTLSAELISAAKEADLKSAEEEDPT